MVLADLDKLPTPASSMVIKLSYDYLDYNDKGHPSYLITSNFKFEKASSDYI